MNKKKQTFLMVLMIGALIAITIFITLSIGSYCPTDPSCFYVTTEALSVNNICGALGAHCAAFLWYMLGGAVWMLVLSCVIGIGMAIRGCTMAGHWERYCALIGVVFISAIVCAVLDSDVHWSIYSGGFIGRQSATILVHLFDPVGRMLFLLVSMLICVIIALRFSHLTIVHYGMRAMGVVIDVLRKYRVVSRCIYAMRLMLYIVFVRPVLVLFYFVQSLLHGSAFDGTGLLVPEDEEAQALYAAFSFQNDQKSKEAVLEEKCIDENGESDSVRTAYTGSVRDTQESNIIAYDTISQSEYALPKLDIFIHEKKKNNESDLEDTLRERAHILQDKLKRFGVSGEVVAIKQGPVVTLFEYQPDIDTKLSKIIALEDDLAMALQALSIRIIAPIPGKAVVGFEVANVKRNDVLFSQLVTSQVYRSFKGSLPLILGKGTIGEPVVVDLARMPHLLIAGSTGSGKSVALNAILISLLCKLHPDELRLILIDPKRLEFSSYADIAHLLFPIVTVPHNAAPVLKWVVQEMEQRYEKMAQYGARNIADYNNGAHDTQLPWIVVIIDELADLMITAGREIEDLITRITQMARAAGIHLIVATQRPSVDVITGLIKANFPSRISFRVASRIDSRTILDTMGADRLLGRGDMLFLDASHSQLTRVHGAYVSDEEINTVVNHIRSQRVVSYLTLHHTAHGSDSLSQDDPLYHEVCIFLHEVDEVSISLVQRKFRIGYNRSARIIDMLESRGLIMPQDGAKMRKVIR